MSQMKEQDKTQEKQLSEVEIGNLLEKKIQNDDSEDDPGSPRKYLRRCNKCLAKT